MSDEVRKKWISLWLKAYCRPTETGYEISEEKALNLIKEMKELETSDDNSDKDVYEVLNELSKQIDKRVNELDNLCDGDFDGRVEMVEISELIHHITYWHFMEHDH